MQPKTISKNITLMISKRQRYTFILGTGNMVDMTMVDFVSDRTLKTIAWKRADFHTWPLKLWLQTEDT